MRNEITLSKRSRKECCGPSEGGYPSIVLNLGDRSHRLWFNGSQRHLIRGGARVQTTYRFAVLPQREDVPSCLLLGSALRNPNPLSFRYDCERDIVLTPTETFGHADNPIDRGGLET